MKTTDAPTSLDPATLAMVVGGEANVRRLDACVANVNEQANADRNLTTDQLNPKMLDCYAAFSIIKPEQRRR